MPFWRRAAKPFRRRLLIRWHMLCVSNTFAEIAVLGEIM